MLIKIDINFELRIDMSSYWWNKESDNHCRCKIYCDYNRILL